MCFDPIIPLRHSNVTEADIREIHNKYGFRRFFLNFPTPRHMFELDEQAFLNFAQNVLELKQSMKDIDVELNWWCAPSINCGEGHPFQHIVNHDGKESPIAYCPLDPEFRQAFATRISSVARIAQFPIIQFEDDFELSNHPGITFGCFCPLHMLEFKKATNREFSREELVSMFRENKYEDSHFLKLFNQLRAKSLALLATDIRKALDAVSPNTRLCLCEPGTSDYDGDITMTVAPALAGTRHRPLIRVYGSAYFFRDSPQELPWMLAHAMFTAERTPKEWELMHESDTIPHSRFFMSDTFLGALMANAFSIGLVNSLLYACQYIDYPFEDDGYLRMASENRLFFNGIISSNHEGTLDGIRILHTTDATSLPRLSPRGGNILGDTAWILARLGFPFSTKHGSPVLLTGEVASSLDDSEIKDLLNGALLLDATAAEVLDKRGFAEYIGVHVKPQPPYHFVYETMADIPDFSKLKGRKIYNFAEEKAPDERSFFRLLKPFPDTEVLSHYITDKDECLQPGMCRFVNKMGGRIGVLASSFKDNVSPNLLCNRKKQMLKILVEWLRKKPLPAVVLDAPNTWILVRRAPERVILTVTSLTLSRLENICIAMSPELTGEVEELGKDGLWHTSDAVFSNETLLLPNLSTMQPRVFRIHQ